MHDARVAGAPKVKFTTRSWTRAQHTGRSHLTGADDAPVVRYLERPFARVRRHQCRSPRPMTNSPVLRDDRIRDAPDLRA